MADERDTQEQVDDAPNIRSSQASLRLARLVLALARQGEPGLTREELLTLPALRPLYSEIPSAAEQALRRDLIALTGQSLREHQRPPEEANAEISGPDPHQAKSLVYYDSTVQRYRLAQPLGTLHLTAEALEVLCLLMQALHEGNVLPGGREFFDSILAALPEEQRAGVAAAMRGEKPLRQHITLDLGVAPPDESALTMLPLLQRAMRERQTIAFAYQPKGLRAPATEHSRDEVLEVRMDSSHYYVTIWCDQAQRELDLRLDRIVRGSLRLYPLMAQGRRRRGDRIRYRLSAEVARSDVTRRLEEQTEEWQPDGSVIVSGRARSLFWARKLLLKYGSGAQALEPPRLAEEMRHEAERMVALYTATDTDTEAKDWGSKA